MTAISALNVPPTIFDPQLPLFEAPRPTGPLAIEPKPYVVPAEQLPFWYEPRDVAMTQEPSYRTPDAVGEGNGNCGPTSAVMALRLVGLDVPGFHGERTQKAIDAARILATGANDANDWTNANEMRRALEAGGAIVREANGVNDTLDAVRQGKVALILGNVNTAGWPGGSHIPPTYDKDAWAGHFVVASRYYPERDAYAINDPGDPHPYFVTGDQLRRFATGGDGENINPGIALVVDGPATTVRPSVVRRGDHAWGGVRT
jgi:hypothetical protein